MKNSRRWGVPLVALATATTWVAGPIPTTSAAAPRPAVVTAPGCHDEGGLDLDGDARTDVVAGDPHAKAGGVDDAGVVEVRYGCGTVAPQRLALPSPHRGDRFGAAVVAGEYLQDVGPVRAVFVGIPYLDVGGRVNAGGVAEFHGSRTGLTFVRLWTQATPGVPGNVQSGAHFGAALSLSRADEDVHLQIGEPGRDVGHAKDTGGYVTLAWNEDPGGHPPYSETTLSDIGVRARDGDLFGSSFARGTSFRVGAPGRRVRGHAGAGAVVDRDVSGTRLVTQATRGVPGGPEKGDHFGAALSGSWIGVPGEALGSTKGAGVVEYWNSRASSALAVDQGTPHVPGDVGADHHFGAALAFADDALVQGGPDVDDLFVGAPGDGSGAGSVTMLRMRHGAAFTGDAVVLPAPSRAAGHFGTSVVGSGYGHVVAGAPGAGGGRVLSYALPSTTSGTPRLETSWTSSDGSTSGTLGASLAGPELDEEG